MPIDIVLPNLGFDAQSGRLIEWVKQVGDVVEKGDVIAIIESDKAEVEFEAIAAGVISELCVNEDDEVPVGSVIARLSDTGDAVASVTAAPAATVKSPATATEARPAAPLPADVPLALPKVRKAARQSGISLDEILEAGYGNPITLEDLTRYQRTHAKAPAASLVHRSAVQMRMAERMSRSMSEAPHFYVSGEIDLENALQRLGWEVRPNDLLQYVTVKTLEQTPMLNARVEDGQLYRYDDIHLAIAIALDDGLIAPVIRHAQRYSLSELATRSRDLIGRARDGRLTPEEMGGGTFTVSNLGMIKQVDQFTAVINPPQVAIAAIGTIKRRPFVIDTGLHLRHTVWVTLSGDHRFVDGMTLARFLEAFQAQLDQLQG